MSSKSRLRKKFSSSQIKGGLNVRIAVVVVVLARKAGKCVVRGAEAGRFPLGTAIARQSSVEAEERHRRSSDSRLSLTVL